jgi:signal transduction histidine kinase/ligand-binding sensor domain-containing protein
MNKLLKKYGHFRKCFLFLILFTWKVFSVDGQKLNLYNYNIQQGLVQSQVSSICQDPSDHLWIGTYGGISDFNGKTFVNYSETDGLISNFVNTVFSDHNGNIWVGTETGISKFDGSSFKNYYFSPSDHVHATRAITEDKQGRIWVLAGTKLFQADPQNGMHAVLIEDPSDMVSAIAVDPQGTVWAAVFKKGVFHLGASRWLRDLSFSTGQDEYFYHEMLFDRRKEGSFFLLSEKKMLFAEQGVMQDSSDIFPAGQKDFRWIFQDKDRHFWLVTADNLYLRSDKGVIQINKDLGLNKDKVSAMFQDKEENMWLGTLGFGIYRYSFDPFRYFDQFKSEDNAAVMSIAEDRQHHLFIGTDGSGLFTKTGTGFIHIPIPSTDKSDQVIFGICKGVKDEMLFWTQGQTLWKYSDGKVARLVFPKELYYVNAVLLDSRGGFWVSGPRGCFYYSSDGRINKMLPERAVQFIALSDDSVLVATSGSLYWFVNGKMAGNTNDTPMRNLNLMNMNMAVYGKYVILCTANKGFFVYNMISRRLDQYTSKDGLNNNFVYSAVVDKNGDCWLGTGRGINKVFLDSASGKVRIENLSTSSNITASECNQGAVLRDASDNLWFGTGSGLMVYKDSLAKPVSYVPVVKLQTVRVMYKEGANGGFRDSLFSIPGTISGLRLPFDQNNLSFSYGAAGYKNPDQLQYQYRLIGSESNDYPQLTHDQVVVYSSLPSGNYTFEVRTFLPGVGFSGNTEQFSFVITTPIYKTKLFRIFSIFLILGILVALYQLIIWSRYKQKINMEVIKNRENTHVRIRISEDFHDEIGNNLTRLQLLTSRLRSRVEGTNEESLRLVDQISENVQQLYNGTRDVIWGLNPDSDHLIEIARRIGTMGNALFENTGVSFIFENKLEKGMDVKVPGDYSRNILMIFKEAMSNVLKHAGASKVIFTVENNEEQVVYFILKDNGRGFDQKQARDGNGIPNMIKRAKRIDAVFSVNSDSPEGSEFRLQVKIPGRPVFI